MQRAVPIAVAEDTGDESTLELAERDALRRTLESCQWNVSAAAARLNISRRTIYRKIHRHGLLRHVPHFEGPHAGVRMSSQSEE